MLRFKSQAKIFGHITRLKLQCKTGPWFCPSSNPWLERWHKMDLKSWSKRLGHFVFCVRKMQFKLTSLPPEQCWWNESNTFYISCTRYGPPGLQLFHIEQFSYDLEMKTHKQNRKKQTNGNGAIWLVYQKDTNLHGFWLVKWMLWWKNSMLENFLEINQYFALTSNCNMIGQSNNPLSILGFSLAGKQRGCVLIFSSTGWSNK